MATWIVETRVTRICRYRVEADDEKGAEAATVDAEPEHEEDENEETLSIVPERSAARSPRRR